MRIRRLLATLLLLAAALPARAGLVVIATGKKAILRSDSASIRFGKNPGFATLADPTCAAGLVTRFRIGGFLQATNRVAGPAPAVLPCANWRAARGGFVYADATGTAGGVQKITYARNKLVIRLGGAGYTPIQGPVAYVQVFLDIGETSLHGRFHEFVVNGAARIETRKPSATAAAGELAFWAIIHGDDTSEAHQQKTLKLLERAARKSRKDGRSRFLLAMTHIYRFGVRTTGYGSITAEAKQEVIAADEAFAAAMPLLWDGTKGDSRVPGFAGATKFVRGIAEQDQALTDQGLQDLDVAIAVNAFFNVFDLIPIIQALPRTDLRFQPAFDLVQTYLDDPGTLACVASQPEICSNVGLAPNNLSGSLWLFGDVYAKAGILDRATNWYSLANTLTGPDYEFATALQSRLADAPNRVARYLDTDPTNDDAVVGAGAETCATCHHR